MYLQRAALDGALFPDAIVVGSADAFVFGLNAVSDGLNVVLPVAAMGFAAQLRAAGFEPVGVDLSELLKGGGAGRSARRPRRHLGVQYQALYRHRCPAGHGSDRKRHPVGKFGSPRMR